MPVLEAETVPHLVHDGGELVGAEVDRHLARLGHDPPVVLADERVAGGAAVGFRIGAVVGREVRDRQGNVARQAEGRIRGQSGLDFGELQLGVGGHQVEGDARRFLLVLVHRREFGDLLDRRVARNDQIVLRRLRKREGGLGRGRVALEGRGPAIVHQGGADVGVEARRIEEAPVEASLGCVVDGGHGSGLSIRWGVEVSLWRRALFVNDARIRRTGIQPLRDDPSARCARSEARRP